MRRCWGSTVIIEVSSCRKAKECLQKKGSVKEVAPRALTPANRRERPGCPCSFQAHLGFCGMLSWFCTARATLSPFWNTMS